MSFQLWSVDEYGQGSIIASGKDLDKITKIGKEEVNNINIDNALTAEEKKKQWEAFFVELSENNEIYAGKNPKGEHIAYIIDEEDKFNVVPIEDVESKIMIYLGQLDREPWYATDDHGKDIDNMNSRFLNGKTSYFVKKI